MLFRIAAALVVVFVSAGVASYADDLSSAKPGEIVRVSIEKLSDIPLAKIRITPGKGPPLLFSDGPEYFPRDGIALREDVKPGVFRLYMYHCPESTGAKKTITATIQNLGGKPMKLAFLRYGFQPPGQDYLKIGKGGLVDYFSHRAGPTTRSVAPGQRVVLDPGMDKAVVTKDDLVHAFHELEIDQPARVTVFQRDPGQESVKLVEQLPTLDPKQHGAGRGQFTSTHFEVSGDYDTSDGARQIVIADGKTDPWITGRDAIAGAESSDKGNYGVTYRLRITRKSSDGRGLLLLICKPQEDSNKYCPGSAAAVLAGGEVVALPKDEGAFKQFPQAVMIRRFPPLEKGKSETIDLTYSPPGASCLPTPLLLVPLDEAR
jgi:hypothetical protein